jgi:tight adherence protein C
MSDSTYLLGSLVSAAFISAAMLTHGLFTYTYNRRVLKERYGKSDGKKDQRFRLAENSFKQSFLYRLSSFGKFAVKDQAGVSPLQSLLARAGFRHPSAPAAYFGLRAVAALALPLPYLLYSMWQGKFAPVNILVSLLFSAAGYYGPSYGLNMLVRRRQDRIDRALPDMLDLMTVTMEAGLSLQATINRVSEEIRAISPDLYVELQITSAELRAGIPRHLALKNLGTRTEVQSLKSLVAMMVQSDKMGASIAQGLRTHAEYIRTQRSQKAEEIAAKLPVKILFPMMLFILPALFIVIIGPAALKISSSMFK